MSGVSAPTASGGAAAVVDSGTVVSITPTTDTLAVGASAMSSSGEKVRVVNSTPVALALETTDAGEQGATVELYHNTPSPLAAVGATPGDKVGVVKMFGNSSTGVKREYGRIEVESETTTNSAEYGKGYFHLMDAGTLKQIAGWSRGTFQFTGTLGAGFGPELGVVSRTGGGAAGIGQAGDDAGYLGFYGPNDAGTKVEYLYLTGHVLDAAAASKDADFRVNCMTANVDTLCATIDGQGVKLPASRGYYVNAVKVVGTQGAAVADATDAASTMARLNDLLARLRTHGLIAT